MLSARPFKSNWQWRIWVARKRQERLSPGVHRLVFDPGIVRFLAVAADVSAAGCYVVICTYADAVTHDPRQHAHQRRALPGRPLLESQLPPRKDRER